MENWEKDTSDLNIDDILKEFGSSQPEQPEELPDIPKDEDVLVWDGKPVHRENVPPAIPQDTVRLNDITQAVQKKTAVSEETIPFTPVSDETITFKPVTEETVRFTPVDGEIEPEEPVFIPPEEPKTEPYSKEWEPEYEKPMGDYIPPEPIVFRPRSRLREHKKKLIAGPEKRYYELVELGLGKLQMAIFLCGIVAILSAMTAVMYALNMVPESRMRLLVFGQFLGLLLSALLGSYQLMEGFSDLIKRRFSLNTLLMFSLVACVADGILCLSQKRVPCCAPFSLNMTMSLWSAYQRRNTEMGQMDTMRKAVRLDSVILDEDFYNGMPGVFRGEGQVEDFMDTYRITPGPERTINTYSLIALFLSLGIGVTAGVLNGRASGIPSGIILGVRLFSASLLVSVPATAYIAVSRPVAILERKLHKLGTVLCGWQGVSALNTKVAYPLNSEDLFPSGAVKMNGLKFYGSRNPDQVVAYSAAVMVADGGGLAPLFSQLLESRNGYHFDVETLRRYPNGGVGGVVNGEAVLIGTRSFMKEMDIDIPEGVNISHAVYAAIDGVLNGLFAITYNRTKATALGLTTLCAYRRLKPVITASDFMITEEFIAGKFGVRTKRIAFPDRQERDELAARVPDEEAEVVALTTQEGLAGTAYAITGARTLRSTCVAGVAVQMMGGILGLLIMGALTAVHAEYLITPENLLLYELVWMLPGLLITSWARFV